MTCKKLWIASMIVWSDDGFESSMKKLMMTNMLWSLFALKSLDSIFGVKNGVEVKLICLNTHFILCFCHNLHCFYAIGHHCQCLSSSKSKLYIQNKVISKMKWWLCLKKKTSLKKMHVIVYYIVSFLIVVSLNVLLLVMQ